MSDIRIQIAIIFIISGLVLMKDLFFSIFYHTLSIIKNVLITYDVGCWPWKIIMGLFNLAIGIFIIFSYFHK